MTRKLLFVALLALAFFAPSIADAQTAPPVAPQSLPQRGANYVWDKTLLRAAFSYRDVMDRPMIDKLSTGLPTVIAMRAYVFKDGSADPIALSVRTCRVVYDLWDEVYRVRLATSGAERESAAATVEGVLRQCAEVRDQAIVDRSLMTPGVPHYLGVIVEVNPVSQQMIAQMRQWVLRPAGATSIGPGNALFGSFAGLFVRTIPTADRTIQFRTPPITP